MLLKGFLTLTLIASALSKVPKTETYTTVTPENPTTESQSHNCTTRGGEPGECVPHYLCDKHDVETGIIDIAGHANNVSSCKGSIEVCCLKPVAKSTTSEQRKGCGWRNPLGIETNLEGFTKFSEFPWMCAVFKIETKTGDNAATDPVYIGGGSLIHPSVVLTAAHLASFPHLLVRAGEWDTQTVNESLPHHDRKVTSAVIHEDFNEKVLFYDIALLFLSEPMELAPNVGIACLPPPRELVPTGTNCFATGWGKDKFGRKGLYNVLLKMVELPTVDHSTCQNQLRKTRLGNAFTLHSSFMCAGGQAGIDTCTGDGGSPLSCPVEFEDGRYMQSGIVSWGIGCGHDGTPGVYVDVSNSRNWIDDKIAGKGYDPRTYSV